MRLTPIKTPKLLKTIFPKYVWNISNKEKVLYLTFDDGPTPEITNWILNTLKAYNAKATFFCIGANVNKFPDIFKHIIESGHAIGNHTANHLKGWKTKKNIYLENIKACDTIFKSKNITPLLNVKLFRPPYGKITRKQAKALLKIGYKIIMWDVLSFDWDSKTKKETCFKNVITNSKPGSIIVFHDSKKASRNMMYALPKVLDYFSKKGYVFKSIA